MDTLKAILLPAGVLPDLERIEGRVTVVLSEGARVVTLTADPQTVSVEGGDLLINERMGFGGPVGPVLVENAVGEYRIWVWAEKCGEGVQE